MLKRTSIKNINKIFKENPKWKILDIGCGYRAHPYASVIADVQDLSNHYEGKKFIISILKAAAKQTSNTLDDQAVDFVKARLSPSSTTTLQ